MSDAIIYEKFINILIKKLLIILDVPPEDKGHIERHVEAMGLNKELINEYLRKCFYLGSKDKFIVIDGDFSYRLCKQSHFTSFIKNAFVTSLFDAYETERSLIKQNFDASTKALVLGAPFSAFLDTVIQCRNIVDIRVKYCVFQEREEIVYEPGDTGSQAIVCIKIPISFTSGPINAGVVADYKEHFPVFDEFLQLLAAARFAGSRRSAYLWIKCPPDWGKSFLADALGALDIILNTSVSTLARTYSGLPSALTPEQFERAWVIHFEEFNGAVKELKNITETIILNPKGRSAVSVPVYLKLFTSAEDVPSLLGTTGVDGQFIDRFSLYEGVGSLSSRELFNRDKTEYFESIKNYIADVLNKYIEEFVEWGKDIAKSDGSKMVEAFHKKHPLSTNVLEDNLCKYSDEFVEWVKYNCDEIKKAAEPSSLGGAKLFFNADMRIVNDYITEYQGNYYMRSPQKCIKDWVKQSFGADGGQLSYKALKICALLGEYKVYKINGRSMKAIMLPLHPI